MNTFEIALNPYGNENELCRTLGSVDLSVAVSAT
jgi:hypothetical protein